MVDFKCMHVRDTLSVTARLYTYTYLALEVFGALLLDLLALVV
jgi:hypothetical protein